MTNLLPSNRFVPAHAGSWPLPPPVTIATFPDFFKSLTSLRITTLPLHVVVRLLLTRTSPVIESSTADWGLLMSFLQDILAKEKLPAAVRMKSHKWKNLDRYNESIVCLYNSNITSSSEDEVAEWLRRWTANPFPSGSVGSNPILVECFFFCVTNVMILSRSSLNLFSVY